MLNPISDDYFIVVEFPEIKKYQQRTKSITILNNFQHASLILYFIMTSITYFFFIASMISYGPSVPFVPTPPNDVVKINGD